jgi:hypothetical protein
MAIHANSRFALTRRLCCGMDAVLNELELLSVTAGAAVIQFQRHLTPIFCGESRVGVLAHVGMTLDASVT